MVRRKRLETDAESIIAKFRVKHRIQTMWIPTTGTYQASIYSNKFKASERHASRVMAIRNLGERLKLEGWEKL